MRIDYFSDLMFLILFTEVEKSSSFLALETKTYLDILVIYCCFWMLMNSSLDIILEQYLRTTKYSRYVILSCEKQCI